ncbi:Hypothetical predicted protein [Mytilus galloprovincialis]|uniref:Endonuclease/exonuclease/phosphatase domain-containing protein n=1 Tax=Mytilus galloprovincialis TaxID=29158 RepID=A0A8B6FC83_MYTGA|nr:Hypothetical predicted protein [Mytilus galloprovincialis]
MLKDGLALSNVVLKSVTRKESKGRAPGLVIVEVCDVLALTETFLRGDERLNIPGYTFFGHNRKILHRNATRGSAGVGLLVKNEICNFYDVDILDIEIEGIQWIKFKTKSTDISVIVAVCYLPPADSSRAMDSDLYFQNLLQQVYSYQKLGKNIICGDFNSRVGQNTDYVEGVDNVKPRNIVDFSENHQGDIFINFLSDINFAMLNGRFHDHEFTCISTSGKSVVDYMCVPYEDMEYIKDFKIVSMSTVINEINYMPDKIPDHSLLVCDVIIPGGPKTQNIDVLKSDPKVQNRKFKLTNVPNDFLKNIGIIEKVNETIIRIENSIQITQNVQTAYNEFQLLIHSEMENKLSVLNLTNGSQKRKKSLYKPYWNDNLSLQWNKVCESEKKWLKFQGSKTIKRKLKEEFYSVRKQFDRLNQKYKRKYVYQEQQKLEDQLNACSQSEFWKSIGKTGIANERKPHVPWAIIDDTGNVKTDKKSVLNKWKDEFQTLFTNNSENNNNLDESDFNSNIDVDSLNGIITRDEILLAVTQAKNRKAAGIDDIPAEMKLF